MAKSIVVEQWRPVVGYEGLYSVSNMGRIFSHRRGREIGVKAFRDGQPWYVTVALCGWRITIHQLVAAAFIGPCPIGHEVNHINGNKGDARAENLEYVTGRQNMRHAVDVLGFTPFFATPAGVGKGGGKGVSRCRGIDNPHAMFTNEQIARIRRDYSGGEPQRRIAKRLGVNQSTISKIVRGVAWSHLALAE